MSTDLQNDNAVEDTPRITNYSNVLFCMKKLFVSGEKHEEMLQFASCFLNQSNE
jgi:hypothetical protein